MVGDARFALLGEASHGSHEFPARRAELTKRLIVERGDTAVAVEADWPDAYRVNCFVQGASDDPDPEAAPGGFGRFPQWPWRNTVVRDVVAWLRAPNAALPREAPKVGFSGLDLYSLNTSIAAVVGHLDGRCAAGSSDSSAPGGHAMENTERIVRYTASEIEEMRRRGEDQTDYARLDAMTEEELEASIDHDEEGAFDWSTAQVGIPGPKQQLTVRFDRDVVAWFKAQGAGCQTRMNAVLRGYVDAHKR